MKKIVPLLLTLALVSGGCSMGRVVCKIPSSISRFVCKLPSKIEDTATVVKDKVLGEKYVMPVPDGPFLAKGVASKSKNGLEVFVAKYKDKTLYKKREGITFYKAPINETTLGWEVILKDADGYHRLTNNTDSEYHPKIDPQGTYVVFERQESSKKGVLSPVELYKIDLKTNVETKLIEEKSCKNPAISPNGEFIAFNYGEDIWVMDKDGKNARELLNLNVDTRVSEWAEEGLIFHYKGSIMPNAIIDFEKREVREYSIGQ